MNAMEYEASRPPRNVDEDREKIVQSWLREHDGSSPQGWPGQRQRRHEFWQLRSHINDEIVSTLKENALSQSVLENTLVDFDHHSMTYPTPLDGEASGLSCGVTTVWCGANQREGWC